MSGSVGWGWGWGGDETGEGLGGGQGRLPGGPQGLGLGFVADE